MRLRARLPLAFAITTLVFAGIVALAAALLLRGTFFDRLEDDMSRQAQEYAAVLTFSNLGEAPGSVLQELTREVGAAGDVRFTLIASDGRVLADSEADPATLENHADRPEVVRALGGVEGRERRQSSTLGRQEVYVAIPLAESTAPWSEGVLRAAVSADRIDAILASSWLVPLIVWGILLLPTLGAAYLLSRSLVSPLERLRQMTSRVASGDFGYRNSVHRNDELGELADSLNNMAQQLQARAEELDVETQRSNEVLAAMTEGVILVDADGVLLRSNPAAERILGADLRGREGTPLVHAARAFPARMLANRASAAGKPAAETLELAGGRSLHVEVISVAAPTGGPQTLFVIRDETSRRATDRMRRDFATNVSHELKTPLAGLSLLAETLTHTIREDPDQAERFVFQLRREIGRLKDLTDDLLTLSRLEDSESVAEILREPIDLGRLAAEVVAEATSMAAAKSQELSLDLEEGVTVRGDAVSLRTLIRNLVDNAIRYTQNGGRIQVALHRDVHSEGEETATLTVLDNGVGISVADQRRVFERFYRVDRARSRETGGTGLGLSIVRHIAETHGGGVDVESTLGVGSGFTVRLPVV